MNLPEKQTMFEKIDKPIFYLIIILMALGILFVYSASYNVSIRYTGGPYYFTVRQIIWVIISLVALVFFMNFDYRELKKFVKPVIFATILLMAVVFLPGIGRESGGARRWIDFRLFSFNPSELAKLTVIIYLSFILSKKQSKMNNFTFGILPPLLLVCLIFFIILLQSGFSTSVLLLLIAFMLFFIGGASIRYFIATLVLSIPVLAVFIVNVSYRKARILSFLNPWEDSTGKGYHIIQSLKSFGEGGFFGVGLGNSLQKMTRLPTPHTDFIYSVIAEETGLLGASIVALLFLFFFIRGVIIARNCEDKFGQLLAFGIVALITAHAFLNMGIAAGIVPPTGVSLPFISSGGSSMLVLSIGCGILLNISSQNRRNAESLSTVKEIENIIDEGF